MENRKLDLHTFYFLMTAIKLIEIFFSANEVYKQHLNQVSNETNL